MAKTIRLEKGGTITRAWSPDGSKLFGFEITTPGGHVGIFYPTRREMLAIGALFRRAALKAKKSEEKTPEAYEAPTLTPLGKHDEACPVRLYGKLVACTCGAL